MGASMVSTNGEIIVLLLSIMVIISPHQIDGLQKWFVDIELDGAMHLPPPCENDFAGDVDALALYTMRIWSLLGSQSDSGPSM